MGAPSKVRPLWRRQYAGVLLLLDVAVSAAAAGATLLLRFADSSGGRSPYLLGLLAFPFLYVLAAAIGRGYEERYLGDGTEEFRRIVQAAVWLAAGCPERPSGSGCRFRAVTWSSACR